MKALNLIGLSMEKTEIQKLIDANSDRISYDVNISCVHVGTTN